MDAIIIFTLIIIISGIMALIAWGIVHAQKEKEREEEQQRIAEQKRRKEEAERYVLRSCNRKRIIYINTIS